MSDKRVLLLMSPATYRAGAFLQAAQRLNLEVVVGIDLPETLADYWHVPLGVDFTDIATSVRTIVEFAREHPLTAILSVDDFSKRAGSSCLCRSGPCSQFSTGRRGCTR